MPVRHKPVVITRGKGCRHNLLGCVQLGKLFTRDSKSEGRCPQRGIQKGLLFVPVSKTIVLREVTVRAANVIGDEVCPLIGMNEK